MHVLIRITIRIRMKGSKQTLSSNGQVSFGTHSLGLMNWQQSSRQFVALHFELLLPFGECFQEFDCCLVLLQFPECFPWAWVASSPSFSSSFGLFPFGSLAFPLGSLAPSVPCSCS